MRKIFRDEIIASDGVDARERVILKLYQKKISDGSLLGLVCRGEMSNLTNMEVCMKVLFLFRGWS